MALPQFIRERILGVLGPGKPSRADFEVLKRRRFLFPESVHMILMLVGDDNEIEMGARRHLDVLDHIADLFEVVADPLDPGL
jgi:hypothetical protein